MRRQASILATLAAAAILVLHPRPVERAFTSARKVERCFRDLRSAGASLSPVERLVLSLVLANAKNTTPQPSADIHTAPRM
jgi:hypothetical protein